MKRKPGLYVLPAILIAILISCGKGKDVQPSVNAPDSIHVKFRIADPMMGSIIYSPDPNSPAVRGLMYLTYQNGRPTVRIGGLLTIPNGAGYSYMYSLQVYDSIVYEGNTAIITTYGKDGVTMPPNTRKILQEHGRILHLITQTDTSDYYYTNNRIARIETHRPAVRSTKTFLFDDHGNLQKVSTNTNGVEFMEETFGGYDDHPNGIKQLGCWSDLYYRSLSANNFTTYSYKKTRADGGLILASSFDIGLAYDSNGYVDYSK